MATPSDALDDALRFLASFADVERGAIPPGGLSLDRTREIADALGSPQERYPSIIIAGTNGKGSTAAMVEHALRASGHHTGLYTQPHLHTIRERIRIDGDPISPDAFAEALGAVHAALDALCDATRPTTAYEVMTCAAFQAFADAHVDVAVLEVGLGGRLDSTNIAPACVSVITPISLDHTQILGDTIEAIAAEKADVIKPAGIAVSASQPEAVTAVIRATAHARGAELRIAGQNGARWDSPPRAADLVTAGGRLADIHPSLAGLYQRTNVAVAAIALDALRDAGFAMPLDAVRTGLERAVWPGRFEVVSGTPPIVIDGAHNVAAAEALRAAIDARFPAARCTFVIGVAADKDLPGILEAVLDDRASASRVVATRAHHPRAVDPGSIATQTRRIGVQTLISPTVPAAITLARQLAEPAEVVVACGSLYVVAEAREALGLAQREDESSFDPWATR